MDPYMERIRQLTFADLASKDGLRQIEVSLLWSTVGEVESDILAPEKLHVKRKHKDFDHSFHYACQNFESLFDILIGLMVSTDLSNTQAQITLEITPLHTAFICISNLAVATDERAVAPILSFVSSNGSSCDWRRRYTSSLLLSAATQVPSFHEQPRHVLFAFEFFVRGIIDSMPGFRSPHCGLLVGWSTGPLTW
jgi:hypothetical protein